MLSSGPNEDVVIDLVAGARLAGAGRGGQVAEEAAPVVPTIVFLRKTRPCDW